MMLPLIPLRLNLATIQRGHNMPNLAKDYHLQRQWEKDVLANNVLDLEWAVEWIQTHLRPEDVFLEEELTGWAHDHNMEEV